MFRKLRAYRAPMAVLLVVMLLGAMFSIQMISSNSRSLGYSIRVEVEGLAPGEETQVVLTRSSGTRYGMTQDGVAVIEDLVPGTYTIYTDPNNNEQMAVGTVHIPTQHSVTLQRSLLHAVTVAVTGSDAGQVNSAALFIGNSTTPSQTVTLQNGRAIFKAAPGSYRVEIYSVYGGAPLDSDDVVVGNSDVVVAFQVGNDIVGNDLTVRVRNAGAANITLYDTGSNIVHETWVSGGIAQFFGLKSGRYLVEVKGEGANTGALRVVNLTANQDISIDLVPIRNLTVYATGSRSNRAVYVAYSINGQYRLSNGLKLLSGGQDTVQLPEGSYTVYLYDTNQRSLASRSVRLSGGDASVSIRVDNSSTTRSSGYYAYGTNRWRSNTSTSSSRTADATGTLSSSKAESAAKTALDEAKRTGERTVTVRLKDVESATRSNLRKLAENSGGRTVQLQADSMNGGKVDVRITLNPAVADRELNLRASTTSTRTATVQNKFEKWYKNRIRVIEVGQKEAWGQPVRIAAQVDLDKFDTGNLCLYTYNPNTNSYKQIAQPGYRVDSKGYLHFTTDAGGDIIISDGPFRK